MEATAKAAATKPASKAAATEAISRETIVAESTADIAAAQISTQIISAAESSSAEPVVRTEPGVQAVVTEGTRLLLAIGPTRITGILPAAVVVPLPPITGIAVDVAVRASIEIVAGAGCVEGPCLAGARVADGGLVCRGGAA